MGSSLPPRRLVRDPRRGPPEARHRFPSLRGQLRRALMIALWVHTTQVGYTESQNGGTYAATLLRGRSRLTVEPRLG